MPDSTSLRVERRSVVGETMMFKTVGRSSAALGFLFAVSAPGCKLVDKVKDAVDGENESYCEAVCAWAVDCADGQSDLTADEMMARCIEATEGADPNCGGAEDGLPIDDAAILNECTADVAEMDCSALTGSESEIMGGHPPVATCMIGYGGGADEVAGAVTSLPAGAADLMDLQVYSTYNAARNAVMETGSEVCYRFEDTICNYVVECLLDKGGVGIDASTQQTVVDECKDRIMGSTTDSCISGGRYDSMLPIDYNLARYSAMECMDGMDETAASDGACAVFTSLPPTICAGAFSSPEQVEAVWNGVISFAGDYDVSF